VAHELAPGKRAGDVGDLHAGVLTRLPDGEGGPGDVGRDRHPAQVHDVHDVGQELAARGLDLVRGGVGVAGGDVRRPR
jgi:hypothetical protein